MPHLSSDLALRLGCVAIPLGLRGFETEPAASSADQAFAVTLDGARVSGIVPVPGRPTGTLLSGFVDLHVHLDKNYTVERTGAAQGDLFKAITRIIEERSQWTASDLHQRMSRALTDAYACGTRAMRTHLDWADAANVPPSVPVLLELRASWADRLSLQWVSLTPLDLFADAQAGATIAAGVHAADGILGAFVYRNQDIDSKLQRVFELAVAHGLRLDFHVDEGLHGDADGLGRIARLTLTHGMQGRVTCGHACSLSAQDAAQAQATLALCAEAGIHLVALPTTNLYLQGAWHETPVQRGITRLKEAQALGVSASIATDNVADVFYPYGSYDLLDSFGLGVQAAHLATAQHWLDSITTRPALAMGLAWDGRLQAGCPADLVLLDAANEYELLSPLGRQRTVVRAGQVLAST